MTEIQDYKSSLGNSESRKFETFSYLPQMDEARIRQQVTYIVTQGWDPAIEHTEPEKASGHYWYMWKLPMFGQSDVDAVLQEAAACHEAYPQHHVRLIGYNHVRQSQGTSMVIYRGSSRA